MIYIFDKTQAIIKVLTNDDFTAAHLNFKINTATTFEFSLPASKALPSDSKYVATPHPLNDSKFIMLRLTERVDNTETIDYSAYELAYQELATDGYIEDKRPQNQSALNLMKIALDGTNWELNNVNVSGTATTNFYYVDHLSAISNVVDLLGGEIVFYIEIQGNAISGRYMDYLARQGADTSKVFASGSNLLTVERQSDTSGIYTAILPRGKGEEIDNGDAGTPDGYGRRINVSDVEWKKSSGNPLDKPKGSIVLLDPDATAEWGQINGNARLLLQTYDDIDDVNVLINSAYKTLQSVNHPQIQYSATVADVGGLSLGDTVLIMHGDRDLSYKTRVFEVKYDLLSPDQTELSLGDDLSSNSITSQINNLNAVADTTSSQTQWTINQIGRPSTTFGNTEPANPKVGYVFFKELPDGGTEIYRWNGDIWELLASPTTADDIAAAVDDAVSQAKEHTATAIEQNNASQQEVMNDIAKSQADLAIKDADFNGKAQAMADKALADAKSNTTTVAQDTLNSANQNIAQAKSDITDAYKNADGVISKKVDDTATSIGNTISQNKIDSDGKISTAQSTATQALNEVTTKVSQTDYDQKTGDLTQAVSKAQTTADGAVTTVGNYQTSNDERVASAESAIQQNASAITQKVSQTDYDQKTGELSGKISAINQTASEISQTVSDVKTQVDGLSVGGRNLFLSSRVLSDGYGITGGVTVTVESFDSTTNMWHIVSPQNSGSVVGIYLYDYATNKIATNNYWSYSADIKGTGKPSYFGIENGQKNPIVGNISSDWSRISQTGYIDSNAKTITMYFDTTNTPLDVYIKLPKLEVGNLPTDWTPAPEDVDNKISTVSQTVDSISSIVLDPATGVTKRVQTAEGTLSQVTGADIPNLQKATYWQNPNGYDLNTYLTQGSTFFSDTTARTNSPTASTNWMYLVVERTPYGDRATQTAWYDTQTDAKITYRRQYTGTWGAWYANDNDSVTTISQTNESIKTEISNRQTGDTNTLTQAKDFTTSSISNSESGMKSLVTQTSDAILGKIGAVNLFPNSEFEEDYGYRDKSGNVTISLGVKNNVDGRLNGTVEVTSTAAYYQGYCGRNIPVYGGQSYSISTLVHYTNGGLSNGSAVLDVWFIDKDGNRISQGTIGLGGSNNNSTGQVSSPWWVKLYIENLIAPTNAVYMQVSLVVNDAGAGQYAMFTQPMVTATEKLQPYAVNNDITTQLALLKDNWSIGITDNIGKITSGIVGNYDSMSLISKNIVLDGNTTVTGTFKVSQANIANGAIGTAQIGDAAITNAKIADLDVSKITGDVTNFIQSYWNGVYGSTSINSNGLSVQSGSTVTTFDSNGAHFANNGQTAHYEFGNWNDVNNNTTSSSGLYLGATGNHNSFIDILAPSGAASVVIAGYDMDYGGNTNIVKGAVNLFYNTNVRSRLLFKGNNINSSTYIEANEVMRTLNFYTDNAKDGNGNWFYFNHKVLSTGTFSSTSLLSKKNVIADYEEDALGEISKTDIVEFEYKNDVGEKHISPIIDDVNDEKDYYIPKTILGQDGEYVDMYSMISMAWKAIQQLNEKIGDK